jgi:inosine-uridine nucleoside N-ribohydrolase
MHTPKHKLIIDTDPGVDDALAIVTAAYHPDVELLGLTTIFGNVSTAQATLNTGYLLGLLPQPVPVAQGADKPLTIKQHPFPEFVHGKNGFGDITVDYPSAFTPITLDAADFIIQQIEQQPGEVTLLPIGPLTNIATALKRRPEIVKKVKQVVIMGGSVNHRGNVSPVAEANIWNDPHAAQIVLSTDWPVTMVGLNVTHQTIMHESRIQALAKNSPRVCGFLAKICDHYAHFYRNTARFNGFSVHDPAAVVCLLRPDFFKTQRGQVDVICEGLATGQTMFGPEGFPWAEPGWGIRHNVKVCTEVDKVAVLGFIEEALKKTC